MRRWLNESLEGTALQKCTTLFAALLLFLAPHKFGNSVSNKVFSLFPTTVAEVFTKPWPLTWIPPLCGAFLVLAMVAHRGRYDLKPALPVLGPIFLALLACGPGWVLAASSFHPLAFTLHVASWLAFACALVMHLQGSPKCKDFLFAVLFASVMILCVQVLIEYFVTLPLSRQMLEERIRLYGAESVPSRMMTLVKGNRPQAYFVITNSLAAHLILVIPTFVALGIRWGAKVDPPEQSKKLLPIIMVIFPLFCLYTTKSRAAILAFCMGIAAAGVAFAMSSAAVRKRYGKMVAIALVLAPALVVGLYVAFRSGRGASSMFARFDYWRYAAQMFAEKPLTGYGLGEFFHHYLRLKPAAAEVTRQPHNMTFLFLSNCGILGGVAASALILSPVWVWNRVRKGCLSVDSPMLYYLSLAGVAAWLLHSQADFNVHVPATVLTMAALALIPLKLDSNTENKPNGREGLMTTGAMALLAAACLLGCLRFPGDYHLSRLEQAMEQRDQAMAQGGFHTALEGMVPLVEKAVATTPGWGFPWEMVGIRAMREGRYDVAATAYGHVVQIDPHFAAGHYHLAEALFRLGKIDEARKAFEQGRYWHPTNSEYDELESLLYPSE